MIRRAECPDHLVPHVTFVEFDAVFGEEGAVLLLKRPRPMMLFLRIDVRAERIEIGGADGECSVTALPRECFEVW